MEACVLWMWGSDNEHLVSAVLVGSLLVGLHLPSKNLEESTQEAREEVDPALVPLRLRPSPALALRDTVLPELGCICGPGTREGQCSDGDPQQKAPQRMTSF